MVNMVPWNKKTYVMRTMHLKASTYRGKIIHYDIYVHIATCMHPINDIAILLLLVITFQFAHQNCTKNRMLVATTYFKQSYL